MSLAKIIEQIVDHKEFTDSYSKSHVTSHIAIEIKKTLMFVQEHDGNLDFGIMAIGKNNGTTITLPANLKPLMKEIDSRYCIQQNDYYDVIVASISMSDPNLIPEARKIIRRMIHFVKFKGITRLPHGYKEK
jgi:hypothetical protein